MNYEHGATVKNIQKFLNIFDRFLSFFLTFPYIFRNFSHFLTTFGCFG